MVIKRPAGGEADRLVRDLVGDAPERAEAAAARLLVMGLRAMPHIVKALADSSRPEATQRILTVLETLPASRGVMPALEAVLATSPDCAPAAVTVLGAWVNCADRSLATWAFDRLAATAFDESVPGATRAAAVRAIAPLDDDAARAVLERLRDAVDPLVRDAARGEPPAGGLEASRAAPGDDPERFRRHVAAVAETAPLTELHHLLEQARTRQQAAAGELHQAAWLAARAAVHQALAARGSTLGLYDVREVLERLAGPPPVALIAALATAGDASCVDALATAWDRVQDVWTRQQLREALVAICARCGLTKRHAAIKKLVARAHPLADAVPANSRRPKGQRPVGSDAPKRQRATR